MAFFPWEMLRSNIIIVTLKNSKLFSNMIKNKVKLTKAFLRLKKPHFLALS